MGLDLFKTLFVLSLLCLSESYKILVFYPTPIISMNMLGHGIVRHLLDAGHEVTYVTAFPFDGVSTKKLQQVAVTKSASLMTGDVNMNISYIIENSHPNNNLLYYQTFGLVLGDLTFSNENVTEFLKDTSRKFDLVIADYYETEPFAALAAMYNCPFIWAFSITANWFPLRLVDEPSNPAYTVDYLSSNVPPLSFSQRVKELWTQIRWHYYKWFHTMPIAKVLYKSYFVPLIKKHGRTPPVYEDLLYNASLVFCNDFNVDGRVPKLPQNFKLVGGQHIQTPTKPLPKNLQTIMDNAEHGVIYFSMGSNWKANLIPPVLLKGLLQMFGQLKQTVIWKFEEDMPNVPKNVHILQWAPQQSILDHPNCVAFITHSGQLSSIEVVHFGVPIIGIPISFDQFNNIKRAVTNGYALEVPLNYELPKNLKTAVETMLRDPSYRQRAKEVSTLYHDRLVSPGQELAFWVEHVIRTKGAPHLRSPALHVPLYQKLFLDLIIVILVGLAVIGVVLKTLATKVLSGSKLSNSKKNK